MIKVLDEGFFTTIQDLGRFGYLRFGISPSGAVDDYSFILGNILLNNDENTPQLEITLKGPTLEFLVDKIFVIVGSEVEAYLNGKNINSYEVYLAKKGSILSISEVKEGIRAYLIFEGGINSEKVLGSSSFDRFINKDKILKKGDLLKVSESLDLSLINRIFFKEFKPNFKGDIRVILGPDIDRFEESSIGNFFKTDWRVTEKSDRVAIRLDGKALNFKTKKGTIISEGVNNGTIQVPLDGKPIVLLKDRPTTGGYPKIANIISSDIYKISQKRFNEIIKFKEVTIDEAHKIFKHRVDKINEFKVKLGKARSFYLTINNKKYKIFIEDKKNEKNSN
ncbi:MAG: biotin-dependent carboxyltransferase family protein [Caldisericia bacterium]